MWKSTTVVIIYWTKRFGICLYFMRYVGFRKKICVTMEKNDLLFKKKYSEKWSELAGNQSIFTQFYFSHTLLRASLIPPKTFDMKRTIRKKSIFFLCVFLSHTKKKLFFRFRKRRFQVSAKKFHSCSLFQFFFFKQFCPTGRNELILHYYGRSGIGIS